MPINRVASHQDLLATNGFLVEINNNTLTGVTNVGGFNRQTGTLEWADGGSNQIENFSDGLKRYGPLNLVYRVDPSKTEFDTLRALVDASITLGTRFTFTIIKYHNSVEEFRIIVYGALFNNETLSDLDVNASGTPYEVNLEVPITFFEIVKL